MILLDPVQMKGSREKEILKKRKIIYLRPSELNEIRGIPTTLYLQTQSSSPLSSPNLSSSRSCHNILS